ncbi:hypothetical protein RB195_016999 [Necator americanus]|uniref:Uncharacterized protein n=1 Tax=Necator americanus TaxID=51031 RepID=A0ABR1C449_NECAM
MDDKPLYVSVGVLRDAICGCSLSLYWFWLFALISSMEIITILYLACLEWRVFEREMLVAVKLRQVLKAYEKEARKEEMKQSCAIV